MILQSDLHTHTNYSDGKASIDEMARGAVKAGLKALGISEHSPINWPNEWCIAEEQIKSWEDEIAKTKAGMRGKIEIVRGIELDWCSDIDTSGYDYVIGCTHELQPAEDVHRSVDECEEGMIFTVNEFFHGDYYAYTRFYYEALARWVSRPVIDIVGHIDIVTKFNEGGKWFDENDPRYLRPAEDAVAALAEAGLIFEMNSGAISRGYRKSPYPSRAVLDMIRRHGGRIILGSDAHAPENIAYRFADMAELAKNCGFTSHMCWKDGALQEENW